VNEPIILSFLQASPLLKARGEGQNSATISLDLGLTTSQVLLQADRVLFPDGQWLLWDDVEEVSLSESACFVVEGNTPVKIQRFSESFNRFYSLMPTGRAPTLLISGIPMHRVKGIDPHRDTLHKVRNIAPITGRVLDTCTGLGYTAIEAAKTADQVVTIELDPTVLEVAGLNPWSRLLFEQPTIQQIIGDTFDEIEDLDDGSFSRIIHDPPMFRLAGELYSGEFYRDLYRVLQRKGRLFHYVGDLKSRSGRNVVKGVARRLGEAGFSRVVRKPQAFGVVAYK
jgi:predicted methyltransferase